MSLSMVCLAIFLILTALVDFSLITISPVVLGVFAIIAGILFFLEGVGIWSYNVGPHR